MVSLTRVTEARKHRAVRSVNIGASKSKKAKKVNASVEIALKGVASNAAGITFYRKPSLI